MAHDAGHGDADRPVGVREAARAARRRPRRRPAGSTGCGVSIRTRSAAKSPVLEVDRRALDAAAAEVDAEREARTRRTSWSQSPGAGDAEQPPDVRSLVKRVYKSYGSVNLTLDRRRSRGGGRCSRRHREQHRPRGSTEEWRDRKRYLWLIGLVVPSLAFVAFGDVGADRLGRVVLDRPDRDPRDRPGHRPGRRARPLQPARRRDRGAGEGPVLPLDHLPLPADPVRRVRRRDVLSRRRHGALLGRSTRSGSRLDRLHRRHRHQHRPRARPQEGGQRALAVQDRAGPELLRPLLHRAQPRPPRAGRHPGGPGVRAGWARASTQFWPRTVGGSLRSAWRLEKRRIARRKQHPLRLSQRRPQRVADVGGAVGRRWSPGSASASRRTS